MRLKNKLKKRVNELEGCILMLNEIIANSNVYGIELSNTSLALLKEKRERLKERKSELNLNL